MSISPTAFRRFFSLSLSIQIWVALLSAWIGEINGPDDCEGVNAYYVAVGGLLVSFTLSFLLEFAIALVGFRGSLFETKLRAPLAPLIYANAACMISQIAFNIYASYLITQKPPVCTGQGGKPFDPVDVMHGCVWSSWAIILGVFVFMVSAYNLFPDYKDPEEWEKQCECLALTCFCCPGSAAPTSMASPLMFKHRNKGGTGDEGTSGAIPRRLGAIFALMFGHIDFTPTDCIVAFSLAMKRQEIRRKALFAAISRNSRDSGSGGSGEINTSNSEDNSTNGTGTAGVAGSSGAGGGSDTKGRSRRRLAKARSSLGNKTMGGINRATSALRGFRSSIVTSTTNTKRTTASDSTTARDDWARSPASVDGLLSEIDLMESGGVAATSDGVINEEINLGRSSSRAEAAAALQRNGSGDLLSTTTIAQSSGAAAPMQAASPAVASTTLNEVDEAALEDDLVIDDEEAALGLPRPLNATPTDLETLKEAAYYMKYAFAAYGWMLFVFSGKTTGVFRLCCGRGCGLLSSIASRKYGVIPCANPLQAPYFNTEAILQASELKSEDDLVDVRLEGEMPNVLPYYIAIDQEKKKVVLAIRGSLSMEDVIRDLLFEPADLDLWVEEKRAGGWDAPLPDLKPATESTRFAAHSGIFEAARATMADIQSTGALASLLSGPGKTLPDEYKLLVCGHSLGAGVAFLMSLRLRQFFPGLKCWAFSPPGGLATAELSAGAVEWCTSVVCGKEVIPRLTLATFERARDEMVYCAARCRLNKWSIFFSWISGKEYTEKELFYSADDLPAEPQDWLESYRNSLGSTSAKREYVELATKFGPPGKCLYLKPTGEKLGGNGKRYFGGILNPLNHKKPVIRDYKGVWVDGEALVDEGIVISGRMLLDHFPDYALAVLRRLASVGGKGAAAEVSDAAGDSEVKSRMHRPTSPRAAARSFEVE
jgi:sn1-specific diacylglycerol lipase